MRQTRTNPRSARRSERASPAWDDARAPRSAVPEPVFGAPPRGWWPACGLGAVLLTVVLSCVACVAPTTVARTQPAARPVAFDIWQRGTDGQETSLVDLALFPGGDVLTAIVQGDQLRLLRLSPDGQVRASGSWPSRFQHRAAIAVGSDHAAAIAIYSENAENAARDFGLPLKIPRPGVFLVRLDAALHPTSVADVPSLIGLDRVALHPGGEAAVAGPRAWGQALVARIDTRGAVTAEHVVYGRAGAHASYFLLNTLSYDAAGSLLLAGFSKEGTASLRQPASDYYESVFVARFPFGAAPWIAAFSSSCARYGHPNHPSATQLSSGEIVLSLQPSFVGTVVPIPWMSELPPADGWSDRQLFLFLDGATGTLHKSMTELADVHAHTVAMTALPDGTWLRLRELSLSAHEIPWMCPPGIQQCKRPNGTYATHSLVLEQRSKEGTVISSRRIDSQAVFSDYRLWYSPSVQRPLLGFTMTGSLRLHNQRIESQLTHNNPCPTKPSAAAFTREQSALYSSMPPPNPCEVKLHLNQLALVTHL